MQKVIYLFSIVILCVALVMTVRTAIWLTKAEEATGKIIEYQDEWNPEKKNFNHPILHYKTKDGQNLRYEWVMTRSIKRREKPELGNLVPLLYDPARPDSIKIDRFRYKWTASVYLFFLGLFFLILARIYPKVKFKTYRGSTTGKNIS